MQKDAEDFVTSVMAEPSLSAAVGEFMEYRHREVSAIFILLCGAVFGLALYTGWLDLIFLIPFICVAQHGSLKRSEFIGVRRLALELSDEGNVALIRDRFGMTPALFAATVSDPGMMSRIRIALGRRNAERRKEDLARRIEAAN